MKSSNNVFDDQGVVIKKITGSYTVFANGRAIACTLSTRFGKPDGKMNHKKNGKASRHTNGGSIESVTVGDVVRFVEQPDGTGSILAVQPRRNQLSRQGSVPMPGAYAPEQVIASNVDQVIPVFSAARPAPRWNLLDRYLVSAEAANLPALILITKSDLLVEEEDAYADELRQTVEEYRRIGYRVALTSAVTGEGLDELREALHGRTSVLVGKSGVGKSSILNALQPGLGLRVNAVSRYKDRGKHTTTHLEMFPLNFGGSIIDTPGIREFGLWGVEEEELAMFFPEMRPYIGRCKFGLDCTHDEEPGCALRQAVMAGSISPRRYNSYLRLFEDD